MVCVGSNILHTFRFLLKSILIILLLTSCAKKEVVKSEEPIPVTIKLPPLETAEPPSPKTAEPPSPKTAEPPSPKTAEPPSPKMAEPPGYFHKSKSRNRAINPGKIDSNFGEYKVVLGADSTIKIPGPPGLLRVWIGNKNYNPDIPKTMAQATSTIPALGATAKVTPIAPFEIEPQDSICVQIDPTGSDTFFKLKPKDKGTYEVGAQVLLYKSANCSGTPVPKATTTIKVTVDVDDKKIIDERKKKFGEVFWEKVMKFWGELLALISALILFLLRRHLKKWFGFGGND